MLKPFKLALIVLTALPATQLLEAQWYSQGQYGRPYEGNGAVDRTLNDLRNVASRNTYSHGEHERYEHAIEHLSQFADKLYRGRFDNGKLERSIGDMRSVLDRNRMDPRAREVLNYDLNELYRLRGRQGGYRGGYGYGGAYRY